MLLTNQNRKLTDTELKLAQFRVSIKSPQQLKEWMVDSGRRWLIFDGLDLVDSLDFPAGVQSLMQLISLYTAYRSTRLSGRYEKYKHPITGEEIKSLLPKTDVLEIEELDRVVRYLVGMITQLDPSWSINNTGM